MSKVLKANKLSERPATRTLLAVSLCASLAAFGCTTDRTLGDGDPVVTPGSRTSPTGGASTGTETESDPPPMMSSYSGAQALPAVRPRVARVSAAEAAALLAEQNQPRVRVLGPASPDSGGRPYVSDANIVNTQFGIPARSTVNSSIYSGPNAVVTSGAGDAVVGGVVGGTDAGALFVDGTVSTDATGATAASTIAGTAVTNAGGAVIAPATGAAATPTGAAFVAPPAFASVRTLSPTAAAVVNPPASVSGSPAVAVASSARTAGTVARSTTVNAGTATTQTATGQTATTQSGTVGAASGVTALGAIANPVRVVNANGRVTVTNVTSSGRQQ